MRNAEKQPQPTGPRYQVNRFVVSSSFYLLKKVFIINQKLFFLFFSELTNQLPRKNIMNNDSEAVLIFIQHDIFLFLDNTYTYV